MRKFLFFLLLVLFVNNSFAKDTKSSKKKLQRGVSKVKLPTENVKKKLASGRSEVTVTNLEPVNLNFSDAGSLSLSHLPQFNSVLGSHVASLSNDKKYIYYTIDPKLQVKADKLVKMVRAPHVAIVAIDPKTGKILALAQKSKSIHDVALHSGFPAASLFKVVTTAAALENTRLKADSVIRYRGGKYTLDKTNYIPNVSLDRESMTLEEALGKSCNPVFARVALNYLNSSYLRSYAKYFGFNSNLEFDSPLKNSKANIPSDPYNLARTAAGFGDVTLSPIHAASMMATVANGGNLVKPILVDQVANGSGKILYRSDSQYLTTGLKPSTTKQLMKMMQATTATGTSRKEFNKSGRILGNIPVVGKTGTLKGTNPAGLTRWFIGAAPINNPEIAIAVVTMNPSLGSDKPSYLAREVLEEYFSEAK